MRRSERWLAGGIALLVVAGCGALYQTGAVTAMMTRLASELSERYPGLLAGLRPAPESLQHAWYGLVALAAAGFGLSLRRSLERAAVLVALVFLTLSWCPVLAVQGLLFEPLTGTAAAVVSGLLAVMVGGSLRAERAARLRGYLAGRLTKAGFQRVLAAGDGRQLTGVRELTVLTCRMLNHPRLAGEMKPEELEDFSSSFVKTVAESLMAEGGYLDACDAAQVRVLFGFPVEDPNHAVTAARAALELRQHSAPLVREMEARWGQRAVLGTSVVTGSVTTGLFGFGDLEGFTAVGPLVRQGEALCWANEAVGSQTLVSQGTVDATAGSLEVRVVPLPGSDPLAADPVLREAYELLALHGGLTESQVRAREAFTEGVTLLSQGAKAAALKAFQRAQVAGEEDAVLEGLVRRCGGLSTVLEGPRAVLDEGDLVSSVPASASEAVAGTETPLTSPAVEPGNSSPDGPVASATSMTAPSGGGPKASVKRKKKGRG